jgi:hypothetical protein
MITAAESQVLPDAEAFVRRFQTFWASPRTVPLATILSADVRLVQPLAAVAAGLPAADAWQRRLLAALPSLRGEVLSWSARDELLFIELRLSAREPAYSVEWRLVDRIRLRGGLAVERVAYFDSLALLVQAARQPRAWPRFLRWACRELVSGVSRARAAGTDVPASESRK